MYKSSLKVVLIPDAGGATFNDHWFPYLRHTLTRMGIKVVAKDYPDPILGRAKHWLPFLKKELRLPDSTILIGHSTGATAAMRIAEKRNVLGSILIAPNYHHHNDYHEKLTGYFDEPWDWYSIRNNQKWIVHFASQDDPYVSVEESRHISKMLNSEYYEYDNHGHFGDDVFKAEFPELITIIKSKFNF